MEYRWAFKLARLERSSWWRVDHLVKVISR